MVDARRSEGHRSDNPALPSESVVNVPARPGDGLVIAVLTFRRPDDLAALLPLLHAQVTERAPGARILVVDNDPDAGAEPVVAAAAARSGGGDAGLRYVHEPRPGIAAARNRALDEADGARALIFIDDDERPHPGWLGALLDTSAEHGGPGVVGPVVSDFAVPLEPWVDRGGFFRRRRLPTGTPVTVAATNNLLLDLGSVRRAGLRFDGDLGLAGGSDTLFTRQLTAAAGPLVWCDEAVVTDVVPAARCTRSWVVRRQLRSGNSWSRTSLLLTRGALPRLVLRLRLAGLGLVRLAAGTARGGLGVVTRDVGRRANGVRNLARGLGLLMGAFGATYAEYRRPA